MCYADMGVFSVIEGEDFEIDQDYPTRGKRVSNFLGWRERDEKEGWLWLSR